MLSTLATIVSNTSGYNCLHAQLYKLQGQTPLCVKTHYIFKKRLGMKRTCYFKEKKHSKTAKQWVTTKEQGFSLLVEYSLAYVKLEVQSLTKTTKTPKPNQHTSRAHKATVWFGHINSNNLFNLNFVSKNPLPSLVAQ